MGTPTVLVTGAAGYIGSVLVGHLLSAKFRVIAIDKLMWGNYASLSNYFGNPLFEFHRLDLEAGNPPRRLYDRADVLVPLAALVGAPLCNSYERIATNINFHVISDMVKGLSPQQRVIYPNTNSGYGASGEKLVTELDPLNPISVYGKTKCQAEDVVLAHGNSVSLRLATVFGVSPRMRMDLLINDFTEKITRIKCPPSFTEYVGSLSLFEPHFRRNGVHVCDVSKAFLFAMKNYHMNGQFNLALPDANLTKLGLAEKICHTLGVSTMVIKADAGKDEDKRDCFVSSEKLMKCGFVFEHGLTDGIKEVSQYCQLFDRQTAAKMRNV